MEIKSENNIPLLEVKDFSLRFQTFEKGLKEKELQAIHRLDLTIYPGEIVAVVGASGSGKSLLADAILGILPENAQTAGTLQYNGQALTEKYLKKLRGKEIQLIPQSVNALDPLMKTGKQVETTSTGKPKQVNVKSAFQKVGLAEEVGMLYPFELSGGMSRRVLVANAIASEAKLIIADEPTPGLDPDALEELIQQMRRLITKDKGMMFITHDIEAALHLADKIVVFNAGKTIDVADVADFTGNGEKLNHPYTKALWNALPQNKFITTNAIQKDTKQFTKVNPHNHPLLVKDISYGYNEKLLFKNIDLMLNPGEVVGMFGNSGSGKSTMAQIIAGYLKPKHGEVLIGDTYTTTNHVHPVQLVWQHPEKAINPRWRMKKVIEESGQLNPDIMEAFGIRKDWFRRWPSELSGGELQRFTLVRALSSNNIKYLIADEMTTMLDSISQATIWQAVLEITKAKNIGVLAISHDTYLLEKLSDRIIDFNQFK